MERLPFFSCDWFVAREPFSSGAFSSSICRSHVLQWEQERSPVDWPRVKCIKTEKTRAIGDAPTHIDPAISYVVDNQMVHQLPTRIHVVQESQERKRCASKLKP